MSLQKNQDSRSVRCPWSLGATKEYQAYHDEEWARAVHDDRKHFEFLILESAQAGLSWFIIFKRREGYREAFAGFDPEKVARFDETKVEELMNFSGIVRNRKKIEAAIENAKHFLKIQKEFGSFNTYIWSFVGGKTIQNVWKTPQEVPCLSKESTALSDDMRKRGFRFIGPVIMYSHMQATGLINDHLIDCFCYQECLKS